MVCVGCTYRHSKFSRTFWNLKPFHRSLNSKFFYALLQPAEVGQDSAFHGDLYRRIIGYPYLPLFFDYPLVLLFDSQLSVNTVLSFYVNSYREAVAEAVFGSSRVTSGLRVFCLLNFSYSRAVHFVLPCGYSLYTSFYFFHDYLCFL